jgi:hypothetical protein
MPNGNPQNINGYAIERTSIGNDDFFDIDWFDTSDGQYKTAKVRGSVLNALISNIYTSDGVLNGDRTIDADLNSFLIENLRKFQIDVNPAPFGATGVEFNVNPSGRLFSIKDSSTGERRFDVNIDGSVTFNQEYTFPLADGLSGEVLSTDGSGQISWIPLPSSAGDMTKAQYDPNNDGIVESARKEMVAFINKTGATLTKGTIVFLKTSSVSTTFPEVLKANASTEATSSKTIGAVYEDVLNDATGFIVTSGEVDNLNTSSYSIGQLLWLSTTDGLVTTTPPVQPNHSVFIGIVTRSQNVNGRILYAIQNGYEIGELHDVLLTGLVDGQTLAFDSATNLWKNVSQSSPSQTELAPVINVLNSPPVANDGDRYRIGTTPSGVWSGQANKLAEYDSTTSSWTFETPVADNLVFQSATATTFRFNGTAWVQWAGTPILQNGNTLGSVMRFGTNDNNSVYVKRNNTDVFIFSQNLFAQRGANAGAFGQFNLQNVTTNRTWLLPNKNGTFAMLDDITAITGFIPTIESSEIRRGSHSLSGTTTIVFYGGTTITTTGSTIAVSFGGSTPYSKYRLLTTSGTSNSVVGLNSTSSGNLCKIGWGFRFVGSYIFTDQSSGGTEWFVPNARQFMGLTGSSTLLAISSTTSVESLTSVIGIGSDVGDTNLQVFHNDGSGLCTKIDLGVNFPANKTGAVANGKGYMLELYNAYGSTDVKYRVTNLADNVIVTGTISSNLPTSLVVGMQGQIVRTSGSTSQNVSIDVMQCSWWTLT